MDMVCKRAAVSKQMRWEVECSNRNRGQLSVLEIKPWMLAAGKCVDEHFALAQYANPAEDALSITSLPRRRPLARKNHPQLIKDGWPPARPQQLSSVDGALFQFPAAQASSVAQRELECATEVDRGAISSATPESCAWREPNSLATSAFSSKLKL